MTRCYLVYENLFVYRAKIACLCHHHYEGNPLEGHIWFPIYMGSHYDVQISHKVHHHVLTFFWVKPHTVFHTIIILCISLTAKPNRLLKLHGIASKMIMSSTYFNLEGQSPSSQLIIIAKSVIPSLVPCGTPP